MTTECTELAPGCALSPLSIVDLTVEGGAVARHEGRVVFLDRGLPGEVVSACVTDVKKRIVHASVVETLSASPDAQEAWCPHFEECGACTCQNYSEQAMHKWKEKHIREALSRIGKVAEPDVAAIIASPSKREYRNKMAFAFAPGEDGLARLGLRKRKNREVVEVTQCGMQPPVTMEILAFVREKARELELPAWENRNGYLRFLVVHAPAFKPQGKTQLLVECITGPEPYMKHQQAKEDAGSVSYSEKVRILGQELMDRFSLTGFVHSERRHTADLAQGERVVLLLGSGSYQEQFGHLLLTVPDNAFLQTNTGAASLLYSQIAAEAGLTGTECLWDIYCGVGTISLFLAGKVAEAHGFDIQPEAISAARANSILLGHVHCHFHAGELPETLARQIASPDVIITDPPRAGMDEKVVDIIRELPAHTLVYISCDAGTQARDIARLAPVWKMEKSIPVDMFPYTPHVENIIVLKRVKE